MKQMNEMNQVQNDEIDLFELSQILWDGKWFITTFVVLTALVSWFFLYNREPEYASKLVYTSMINKTHNNLISPLRDFQKKFFSKRAFNDWKESVGKTSLAFNQFNANKVVDGYVFSVNKRPLIQFISIEDKEGNKSLLIDLIIDKELNRELTENQLQLLAQSTFITNNLFVSYDSYKSLVNLRITFTEDVLALNIHNLILEEFDTYLSDLKNTKIEQKNTKLIQKLSSVNTELKELERRKENFINNNQNISDSAYLVKEFRIIEREIGVKESIYLTISSQIELNKVDLSIEKNNFRILNRPVLPLNPSFPKKKLIVIFSTLLALVISSLYFIIKERT